MNVSYRRYIIVPKRNRFVAIIAFQHAGNFERRPSGIIEVHIPVRSRLERHPRAVVWQIRVSKAYQRFDTHSYEYLINWRTNAPNSWLAFRSVSYHSMSRKWIGRSSRGMNGNPKSKYRSHSWQVPATMNLMCEKRTGPAGEELRRPFGTIFSCQRKIVVVHIHEGARAARRVQMR